MQALHWRSQEQNKTASSGKRRIAPSHICRSPTVNALAAGGD
jgi:hypothetical protein